MTNEETFIASLAQTLAPILFRIAPPPEEMGFPIYDTEEEVEDHLARQFDPVGYWTAKGAEIAEGIAASLRAGGVSLEAFDYDAAASRLLAMRPDATEHHA